MDSKHDKSISTPATIRPAPARQVPAREHHKPEGFWSLPGGKDGLEGTPDGVAKKIDALTNVDAHWKTAMKLGITSEITRTGGNWVTIHGHAQRSENNLHVCFHIKTSLKNI